MLTPAELLTRTAAVLSPVDAIVDPWHTTAQPIYTMSYSFVTSQPASIDTIYNSWTPFTETQKTAVRDALAQYAAVIDVQFVETTGTNADLIFGRVDLPSGIAGLGSYSYGYRFSGSNVTSKDWSGSALYDVTESLAGVDGTNLLLHEIGHAFGLKHTGDYDAAGGGGVPPYLPADEESNKYSVMSYNDNPTNGLSSNNLMLYDIAALQQRWGANDTSHSGDDVYAAPAGGFLQAIWDTGGNDTIDGSGFFGPVNIDLRQGSFSSIQQIDDHVIAYGTIIENAVGSSLANMLIGNDSDNVLTGGGGSDTLTGGAGNDTFRYLPTDYGTTAVDFISDFTHGADKIDLTRLFPVSVGIVQSGGLNTVFVNGTGGNTMHLSAAGDIEGSDLMIGGIGVVIQGGEASTVLVGTSSNDYLYGEGGNDVLAGGAGADVLFGGAGVDTFRFLTGVDSNSATPDLIADFTSGEDKIDVHDLAASAISIVDVVGGSLIFTNSPSSGAGQIGVLGTVQGGDIVSGPLGVLILGGDDSTLIGGSANADTLFGQGGNDALIGGGGADVLFGGPGYDSFLYLTSSESTSAAPDLIADFQTGVDKIDLHYTGITAVGIANNIVFASGPGGRAMQIGVLGTVVLSDILTGALPPPLAADDDQQGLALFHSAAVGGAHLDAVLS